MSWKRARTDDKRNERKAAIYDAAYTLFKAHGYDGVSFNGIAAQAGFTKSNMYRYFSSKEEIFLGIFQDLFEVWFSDTQTRLQKLEVDSPTETFSQLWVDAYLAHPEFLDLIPLLFTALERNSSLEQLTVFKRRSKELLYMLTLDIARIYPDIQGDKAFQFLSLSFAATSNYWAGATRNAVLDSVYALDEFKMLKPDFNNDLFNSICIIVKGLRVG
ncbi:TetR/AcrR family transcriptional regulator [Vibrio ulleungensis]|uniref:TetR family transcriptional regulator n=1 Tax=Vibrio ulleungensis TaxID=2807619 RepID=A0ABS2HD90_9VIBR|nr:TetR family transcriptional regulator [Vibrio ulleungensis]MBM7035036.1 TetR family transcriptional regulator [Vibrio ulleungensis]